MLGLIISIIICSIVLTLLGAYYCARIAQLTGRIFVIPFQRLVTPFVLYLILLSTLAWIFNV